MSVGRFKERFGLKGTITRIIIMFKNKNVEERDGLRADDEGNMNIGNNRVKKVF